MCLGIPMKVVRIEGDRAFAELGGSEKEISIALLEDLKVGDYVIVHAGFAIEKLDEKEALETLELIREIIE
ncbi:MAG: HypC/HybG/HupF family hydrogenase formation chaperone [Candidatus Aminicenantia bacterium]